MIIGFLRTLLILVIIYYGFKILVRYIVPFFLGKYVNKEMNRKTQNYNHNQNQGKKEGSINIDYMPERKKKIAKNEGDYVDYEEVKD